MKTTLYLSLLICLVLSAATVSHAQTIGAGKAGKFGIDGDIWSDVALSGIHINQQGGSHDWFKRTGGTGIGLFDTAGAAALKDRVMAGENFAFSRKMQYPRFSTQDGDILMDASYTRDHIGIIGSSAFDKTVFYSDNRYSAQLGGDPMKWKTVPLGGQIPSKTDIVDAYVNMRRNGTVVTGNNPSHIMLHVGATTLSNEGDRYVTFVFLKERMNYDTAKGNFTNSGPAETGGHSPWTFNAADSSINKTGDIAISFNFGSGGVQSIQLLVWCNYTDFTKLDPKKFDFVPNQWYGLDMKSGWGWAGVVREDGSPLQVWGTTNGARTPGPGWGTFSKAIGDVFTNYAAESYDTYQFAEASIDLTSAGLDFALTSDNANCAPPFTRYFVATRSASGFSAPMMDFIGPYEFMDAPTVSPAIASPGHFTCVSGTTLSLSAKDYTKGAVYSWRTTGGSIIKSTPDSSTIQINKPGTYTLSAAMVQGCATTSESVVVGEDFYKPVAKATTTGIPFPGAAATLYGGDAVASNYTTPYGGSKGLSYLWAGPPNAFSVTTQQISTTTLQNPTTLLVGSYQLVVTEARNGCKDTAYVSVVDSSTFRIVLGVKFADFSVHTNREKKVNLLSWKMADVSEVDRFVVEKSADNQVFAPAGYVFASSANTSYRLSDPADTKASYYRIKAVTKSGAPAYTSIIKVKAGEAAGSLAAYNDGSGSMVVNYTATVQQSVSFAIMNFGGQVLKRVERNMSAGSNVFRIGDRYNILPGVYLLQAQSAGEVYTVKIVL